MELIAFNAKNSTRSVRGEISMNVNEKGVIRLSKYTSIMLGLSPGDKVEFFQDNDDPRDWYVKKSVSKEAFRLNTNKEWGYFYFNSSYLSSRIMAVAKCKSASFMLSKTPKMIDDEPYYLILVANPIQLRNTRK